MPDIPDMAADAARVLFIDFSETATHADTLFSVSRFLAGCRVRYLLDPSYRGFLPPALEGADVVWLPAGRGQAAAIRAGWVAARQVRAFRPEAVHVNGAQGNRARSFALFTLGAPGIFSGTHHNPAKLAGGGSQRLVRLRIQRYGVLADFIRDAIRPRLPAGITVETVRPIFFPQHGITPSPDRLRLVVVGSLDRTRRDYDGLVRLLAEGPPLDTRVELVLLGDASSDSGRAIRTAILATPSGERVRFHERFVPFDELFREIEACHALVPLIHPGVRRFEDYGTTKITGASLLALGFRKPMLLHRALADLSDYRGIAIGYDVPELPHLLNRLAADIGELAAIGRRYRARGDQDLDRETARFRALLGV